MKISKRLATLLHLSLKKHGLTRHQLLQQTCELEFAQSYDEAMESAGGALRFGDIHTKETTLGEMCEMLATNGIRFVHDPKLDVTVLENEMHQFLVEGVEDVS